MQIILRLWYKTRTGVMFEIGAILLAAAQNYAMLILGRVFLGVAVGGFLHLCVLLGSSQQHTSSGLIETMP